MDGGRLLRAWFAGHMSYISATRRAAEIGKLIAFLMGLFGLITLPGGLWIILIAFFIYIGASEEERATEITVTLEGIKVKDLMSKNVVSVSPDITGAELVELMFKEKHMGYPVMEDSTLVGIVTFSDIQQVPKDQWSKVKVRDIMTREIISLGPEDDAVDAFRTLSSHNIGRIIIRENRKVVGILSRTDLIQATQLLGLKEK
jgi:CBS domain-containing protein